MSWSLHARIASLDAISSTLPLCCSVWKWVLFQRFQKCVLNQTEQRLEMPSPFNVLQNLYCVDIFLFMCLSFPPASRLEYGLQFCGFLSKSMRFQKAESSILDDPSVSVRPIHNETSCCSKHLPSPRCINESHIPIRCSEGAAMEQRSILKQLEVRNNFFHIIILRPWSNIRNLKIHWTCSKTGLLLESEYCCLENPFWRFAFLLIAFLYQNHDSPLLCLCCFNTICRTTSFQQFTVRQYPAEPVVWKLKKETSKLGLTSSISSRLRFQKISPSTIMTKQFKTPSLHGSVFTTVLIHFPKPILMSEPQPTARDAFK